MCSLPCIEHTCQRSREVGGKRHDMNTSTVWHVGFVVTCLIATAAVVPPCPRGTYGKDCSKQCHCMSGPDYCRSRDGECIDHKCSVGWMGPPYCQTECPVGTYGYNCSHQCHCVSRDQCSRINGLCSSGVCDYGWGGYSCQRALVMLLDAPAVDRQAENELIISWLEWIPDVTGNGTGPVVGYTVQMLTQTTENTSSYQNLATYSQSGILLSDSDALLPADRAAMISESRSPKRFHHRAVNLTSNVGYKFRIQLTGMYDNKPELSWPGPESKHWIVTSCTGRIVPGNVRLLNTEDPFVIVSWKPPDNQLAHCFGFVDRYDVTLSYDRMLSSCRPVNISVKFPETSVTISRRMGCGIIVRAAVRVVNSNGESGPWAVDELATISTAVTTTHRTPLDNIFLEPDEACTLELLHRTEVSLSVKLVPASRLVTFTEPYGCCRWSISPATESSGEHDIFEMGESIKQFYERLIPSVLYVVVASAEFCVNSKNFSRHFSMVVSTAPVEPDLPPTPNVSYAGSGMILVRFSNDDSSSSKSNSRSRTRRDSKSLKSASSDGVVSIVDRMLIVVEVVSSNISKLERIVVLSSNRIMDFRLQSARVTDFLRSYDAAKVADLPFYIAGRVAENDSSEFLIGSGLEHIVVGEFSNPPLNAGHHYLIWLARESSIDGIVRRSFSRAVEIVYVADDDESQSAAAAGLDWWWILLIVLLGVSLVYFFLKFPPKSQPTGWCLARKKPSKLKATATSCKLTFPSATATVDNVKLKELEASSTSFSRSVLLTRSKLAATPLDSTTTTTTSIQGREYSFAEPRPVYESDGTTSYCPSMRTNPLVVEQLRNYCEHLLFKDSNRALTEEFSRLPDGFAYPVTTAGQLINAAANRGVGSIPYDRNRVRLQSEAYINASVVRTIGWRTFIVTQCPLTRTVGLFWTMVWEQNVTKLVALLDNNEMGCESYWPEELNHTGYYDGGIKVTAINTVERAHYIIRHLLIECNGSDIQRRVVIWHYVWWRSTASVDVSVPKHPVDFLDFVKCVKGSSADREKGNTTLVHCVSGGGRSGIFVALDALLDQGRYTGMVDVLKCVSVLRTERSGLVSNLRQYRFIYECLCEEFDHPFSRFSVESFVSRYGNIDIDAEYSHVFTPFYFTPSLCDHCKEDDRQTIGRCPTVKPRLRRQLMTAKLASFKRCCKAKSASNDKEQQISAAAAAATANNDSDLHPEVKLDVFSSRQAFIVSRCPNAFEADSFWDVVVDYGVSCIVALCGIDADIPNAHLVIPLSPGSVSKVQRYTIQCRTARRAESGVVAYISYNLLVTTRRAEGLDDEQTQYQRPVHLLEFAAWPSESLCPLSINFCQYLEQVREWHYQTKPNRPILAFGAPEPCVGRKDRSRAAVFVTMWQLVEQADMMNIVDIFASTRLICSQLPFAIISKEHYVLLYEALHRYLSARRPFVPPGNGYQPEVVQRSYQRATEPTSRLSRNANNSCRAELDGSKLPYAGELVTSQLQPIFSLQKATSCDDATNCNNSSAENPLNVVGELEPIKIAAVTSSSSSAAAVGPIQFSQLVSSSAAGSQVLPASTTVTVALGGPIMTSTPMDRII